MRPRTRTIALLLLGAALAAGSAPAAAQSPVGRMVQVHNQVLGTPPGGDTSRMAVADPVVLDHLIATGRESYARLLVGDHAPVDLGQSTEQRITRHVIEAATGEESTVLELLVGKIQVALDSLFGGDFTVETPTASLGVKGTVFRVLVDPSGRTVVSVLEGVVEVTARAGGTVTLTAGTYTVVGEGGPPLPPAPFDPSLGTLAPSAGGPDFVVPGEDVLGETPLLDDQRFDLPRQPPGQNDPSGQGAAPPDDPNGR